MLEARGVSVEINGVKLLRNVSLKVVPGEVLVVAGPNGAGKSTLLRAITGERPPTEGSVTLDGVDLGDYDTADLARRRAVVPQSSQLKFAFTVREVVGLGIAVPGFGISDDRTPHVVADAMMRADIAHLGGRSYTTLSGGERQRVHLARALCQLAGDRQRSGTRFLMLDEPTASLDLAHQLLILEEARKEAERGVAVFVVLHDLNLAARFGDCIALLSGGRLAAFGTPMDVLHDELLSDVFSCDVRAGTLPPARSPFVLPQACQLPKSYA
ncbi:MAG: heme ABC transporter ATP-binding protein [Filomicrobium sp.]